MFDALMSVDAASVMKIEEFLAFISVVTLCAAVLTAVYRYIADVDDQDEREFASTIFILTIAIGLLVSIIKSAPAISFGLFGAMSIVRFRAQIKRPQRMIFIFMAAAIGVCCGAGQYLTTALGTVVLSALTIISFKLLPITANSTDKSATATEQAGDAPAAPVSKKQKIADGPTWGIDFLPAALADGQRYRVLLIVDETSSEVLAAIPETSISGARVAGELDRLIAERSRPASVISESWPQLTASSLTAWKTAVGVDWKWLDDVKGQQTTIVACAADLHDRCLSSPNFATLLQARGALETWMTEHNQRMGSEDAVRTNPQPRLAVTVSRKPADQLQTTAAIEPFAQRSKTSTGH